MFRSANMQMLPRRNSLVSQTAAILRESIQSGVWSEVLPGEHALCDRLQVSRVTLRGAIELLEREGWLSGGQGKRRRILLNKKRKQAAPGSDQVVLISPIAFRDLSTTAMFWVDALRKHLASAGYRLEFLPNQGCYGPRPEKALNSLLANFVPAGWVLYLSTAAMQAWFSRRELPCVISGSRHPGVVLSSVDIDHGAACAHAVGMFAAKGHLRQAMLMPRSAQAGNLESERGFLEAGRKLACQGIETRIAHHDGSVASICRTLDSLVRGPRAVSAIMVAKPAHVVTALTHLLRRGIRVPDEVSLVSRDDDPILDHMVPSIARYHTDPTLFARKVSRRVVELVQSGVQPCSDSRLIPELLQGETLGSR